MRLSRLPAGPVRPRARRSPEGGAAIRPESLSGVVRRLLLVPWRRLRGNPGILAVIVVVAAFDLLAPDGGVPADVAQRGWLFRSAPELALAALREPWVWALAAAGFVVKTAVSVGLSHQLMLMFRHGRVRLWESIRHLRAGSVVWLTGAELVIYAGAAALFGLAYAPAYLMWRLWDIDCTPVLLVLAVAALPALYVVLSGAIFAAVLPLPFGGKVSLLGSCFRPGVFWPLWFYAAVRTVTDVLFTVVAPVLLLATVHSRLLASAMLAAGLLLPSVLLRGAGYLLIVERLRAEPVVADVFAHYLADVPGHAGTAGSHHR